MPASFDAYLADCGRVRSPEWQMIKREVCRVSFCVLRKRIDRRLRGLHLAEHGAQRFDDRSEVVIGVQAGITVSLSPDSSCWGTWPKVYWTAAAPGTRVNVQMTSKRPPGHF